MTDKDLESDEGQVRLKQIFAPEWRDIPVPPTGMWMVARRSCPSVRSGWSPAHRSTPSGKGYLTPFRRVTALIP